MILSRWSRILLLLVNVGVGLVPSALFFAWIERHCSLPILNPSPDWPRTPWILVGGGETLPAVFFDLLLFLAFGAVHTFTAQSPFQALLKRIFPPQSIRTLYLALTGMSALALMGLWQPTGIVLWTIPAPAWLTQGSSFVLFWGFMAGVAWVAWRHAPGEFLGFTQLYERADRTERTHGTGRLDTSGPYAWVRHPIYAFTLAAIACSPFFMTLDRMLVLAGASLYLTVGIPIEERKLVAVFGRDYEEYRSRVPAIFPGLRPTLRLK